MNPTIYDLTIIGAGPAGLTAAIYAGRYKLNTLIFEQMIPGGQIILSPTIENYPGFPEGISTQELIDKFLKQVEELGLRIKSEEVTAIEEKGIEKNRTFIVKTSEASYETRAIIIASGGHAKKLGVESEEILIGRGVSYCGTCDGPLFRNKDIVVIGGGDRAFEEALFLTTYAQSVTVIHRREGFRASKILEDKAKSNPKIKFILNSVVTKILGKDRVEGLEINNIKTNTLSKIECNGVFVFVGVVPNTGFINNQIKTDEGGFIITDEELKTSKLGIFACGDCRKKSLYQVVNACGDGAVAAHSAQGYLLNL